MKRTLLSLIVAGLFTGLAGAVAAQNVTAGDQPAKAPAARPADAQTNSPKATGDSTQMQTTPGGAGAKAQRPIANGKQPGARESERAAKAAGKADYTAAKSKAKAAYNDAKAKCDALEGDAMRSCMTDAKAARTQALAEAKTQRQGRKGGDGATGGGAQMPTDDTKSDMRSGMDSTPDTSKPDGTSHPQGGRLEKSRDDSIVPEAEKFQNVSTARKGPEGVGADKAKAY